jgi:hypothetical protein
VSGREVELYRAPIDGLSCLRSEGRLRRLKLPLPADPPLEGPPAACFFCHPERDRLDLGPWPRPEGALRVIGNAHPFAERALLVAPPDEALHLKTPATLPAETLAALIALPFDAPFLEAFDLAGRNVAAFVNVGKRAAQSRRHPHLQVVAFDRERGALVDGGATAAAALQDDLAAASAEERTLLLADGAVALVPRRPSKTAEAWLVLPDGSAPQDAWLAAARGLAKLCAAGEKAISGDYNLVWRLEAPALVRVVPRGLSERAGLELAAPALLSGVVATSTRESVLLWSSALA